MTLLTEYQYFPSVILFKKLNDCSNVVFEQYESYQKRSFRNRCRIAGPSGTIDLSIPLQKGREQKTLTKDVRISGSRNWQSEQWKTIVSCYSRSPWFEFYRDGLEPLYHKAVDFLIDWDLACFEWSIRSLGLPLGISFTEVYQKQVPGPEWVDVRGRLLPSAKPGLGQGAGEIRYRQVFEERTGFLPGLSILDLLFCEGKNARRILAGC
jgi:hypothetical protein